MMRDLSMHVLDIAQNSIQAGASLVTLTFQVDQQQWLTLSIEDDGCGMAPEFLRQVTDPFTTTRTTRNVGLGIPMLKQSAEISGGSFTIQSEAGQGTTLIATFDLEHIDCLPMGEMCDTLFSLIVLHPNQPDFVFEATSTTCTASFDTRQVRKAVPGVPLNQPDVAQWIRESIQEEFKPILEEQI